MTEEIRGNSIPPPKFRSTQNTPLPALGFVHYVRLRYPTTALSAIPIYKAAPIASWAPRPCGHGGPSRLVLVFSAVGTRRTATPTRAGWCTPKLHALDLEEVGRRQENSRFE
jgi:hypothetical protein